MNKILQEKIDEEAEKYAYTNWENDDYHEWAEEGMPFDPIGHVEKCFKKGADYALNHQWISTSESLPPCHDDDAISDVSIKVIARTSEGVIRYAYYHHYLQQWFSAETSKRIDNVTKWMFVPEEGGDE